MLLLTGAIVCYVCGRETKESAESSQSEKPEDEHYVKLDMLPNNTSVFFSAVFGIVKFLVVLDYSSFTPSSHEANYEVGNVEKVQ